jgi:hypothetical protein
MRERRNLVAKTALAESGLLEPHDLLRGASTLDRAGRLREEHFACAIPGQEWELQNFCLTCLQKVP